MEIIKTNYKYGFILVQPFRRYFEDGRYVLKRELPHLVNTAYVVDIIVGYKDCLIKLVDGSTLTVDKEELLKQLRLL
jgi:hypothetical protein